MAVAAATRPPIPGPHPPGRARRRRRAASWAGAFAGALAVASLAAVSRVPGGGAAPVAGVTIRVAPSGEVAPGRLGPMLDVPALGTAPVTGEVQVRNTTGTALAVGVQASADDEDLDSALRLDVTLDGVPLADAPLAALRAGTAPRARLLPGRSAVMAVRASLDPRRAAEAGGRAADVTLTLTAAAAS